MSEWRFSDGTILRSGGEVEGEGPLADTLRRIAERARTNLPTTVRVAGPPPGGLHPIILESDWLLDRWVRAECSRHWQTFTTDYVPKDADIPETARRQIERWHPARLGPRRSSPGTSWSPRRAMRPTTNGSRDAGGDAHLPGDRQRHPFHRRCGPAAAG